MDSQRQTLLDRNDRSETEMQPTAAPAVAQVQAAVNINPLPAPNAPAPVVAAPAVVPPPPPVVVNLPVNPPRYEVTWGDLLQDAIRPLLFAGGFYVASLYVSYAILSMILSTMAFQALGAGVAKSCKGYLTKNWLFQHNGIKTADMEDQINNSMKTFEGIAFTIGFINLFQIAVTKNGIAQILSSAVESNTMNLIWGAFFAFPCGMYTGCTPCVNKEVTISRRL